MKLNALALASTVALLVLGGCSERSPLATNGLHADARLDFGLALQVMQCPTPCYEPTIASDENGRIFIADGFTGSIAVSTDGGMTFVERAAPAIPDQLDVGHGDVLLQVSPEGTLYWSTLVYRQLPFITMMLGIQVAWSNDGAETWIGSTYIAINSPAPVAYPDRQWLGFAPDGTVYLTYNQVPTGIWLAKSTDAGETWSDWTRAIPLEQRQAGLGLAGPPVIDSHGHVIIPACHSNLGGPAQVFRSEDSGATFSSVLVGNGCSMFPMAAIAADDTIVLAVQGTRLDLFESRDGGRTFSDGISWGNSPVSPWPIAGPRADPILLAWFDESFGLHVSRGNFTGPAEDVVVATSNGKKDGRPQVGTDFASMTMLIDGRIAVVWADDLHVLVSTTRE